MAEEKKEDIAFEIFGKRVEELKEMTENIGKTGKQNPGSRSNFDESIKTVAKSKRSGSHSNFNESIKTVAKSKRSKKDIKEGELPVRAEIKKKISIPRFPKIQEEHKKEKLQAPEPPKNYAQKISFLDNKKIPSEIRHPIIQSFFGMQGRNNPSKKEVAIKQKAISSGIPSGEKGKIFDNLKKLNEKIDKNKEEMYNWLIRESAESKRMIEAEREEIKKQMIELLAESIDKLDIKDRETKGELYEELQKIKNKFYGEKKEIRNIILSNSEESRKIIADEKERLKEEFLEKIANLRNKINAEEKKEIQENIPEIGDKKLFSLFNRFKRLPAKTEIKRDFNINRIENEKYTEETLQEGDIITGMPEIPKPVDLGLPKFSSAKNFMNRPENELPEAMSFSRIEEEAIDNEGYEDKQFKIPKKFTRKIETSGDYEKSIKNLIAPKTMSKLDLEFGKNIQKAVKKGMDDAEKKERFSKKHANFEVIKSPLAASKKSVYVGERDFKNARAEIEQTRKSVNNFEKSFSEKAQVEKKEHEKISKILEDAEEIKASFSKIDSGVLGKVK